MSQPVRPTAALEALPDSERILLESLCIMQESGVEELAARAFLAPGTARMMLARLASQGLVLTRSERGTVGRPRTLYRLSEAGRQLFPRGDVYLLEAMLTLLRGHDPEAYDAIMDLLPTRFAPPPGSLERPFAERLAILLNMAREFGHIATQERESNRTDVYYHHCGVMEVARAHPGICDAEQRLWQLYLPEAEVELVARQSAGDAVCHICVRRPLI